MSAARTYVVPAGSAATDGFDVDVTPESAGWTHSGLRVLTLAAGETTTVETGDSEHVVVPLRGGADVQAGDTMLTLTGRPDVFAGPTDVAYLPRDATYTLTSSEGGRFALCAARCPAPSGTARPPTYVAATAVPVEMRGAGSASRQVHNFGVPGVLDAERIIACEVLTPAGNWSSWPPHKHDEARDGESQLEEIYYFEVADGPAGSGGGPGVGYQRVYGHEHAEIDVQAEVRSGDVVLIPFGWHGPSMAAPGYDLYYLNVMAGPGERRWLICDDPAHGWVRKTWADQDVDPRLPFGGAR